MLKYGVRNAFRNAFWPSVFGTFLLPWKLRILYTVPVVSRRQRPASYEAIYTYRYFNVGRFIHYILVYTVISYKTVKGWKREREVYLQYRTVLYRYRWYGSV